jgi:hypothetical protein
MSTRESILMEEARACTLCGWEGLHFYHFLTDHVHDGTWPAAIRINIAMDQICNCGHCCSCSEWDMKCIEAKTQESSPKLNVHYGRYYQSICCLCAVDMHIEKKVTYEYCLVCCQKMRCPRCKTTVRPLDTTRFSDYGLTEIECDCGFKFMPRDYVMVR